jgi:hypothetical protein
MRFNQMLHAAPSVLNCQRYNDIAEVESFVEEKKEEIQVIVGQGYVPFGSAQCPGLNDYADGEDVMQFLSELN